MFPLLIMLVAGQCGPFGCRQAPTPSCIIPAAPAWQPAPLVTPQPAPFPAPIPDDAIERYRAEGRAQARAEMRAARRSAAGGPCSDACTCGCCDGADCVCGKVAAPPAERGPLFGREGADETEERPKHYINGRRVPRDEALDALARGQAADPRIPADAGLYSLSLMGGNDLARKALRKALEADPKLKAACKWQDYQAGDPLIGKHKVEGLTVYLQAVDGSVLMREPNVGGAEAAPGLLDRIKDILGWNPRTPPPEPKGPDGKPLPPKKQENDPTLDGLKPLKDNPLLGYGAAAALLLLWLAEKNKNTPAQSR